MESEKHACEKCTKTLKVVVCKKTQKPLCRDCCTNENGGFSNCVDWKFCWTSFYI
ncbi:MAG: hypothetical protein V1648_01190 [Candidatus Aenigmatarchaeota archaeon]